MVDYDTVTQQTTKYCYGYKPDLPDKRDLKYREAWQVLATLPPMVDLRNVYPFDIYNQGMLGSCTGNSIAADIQYLLLKQGKYEVFTPSRLFIYYNERAIEGNVCTDSGAAIRDGIKSVNEQGVCPENMWAYDISKFTEKPPQECYQEALKHQALIYARIEVGNLDVMKSCLAEGFPFVPGFSVYQSFESQQVAQTGIMPMPDFDNESIVGGHAVMAMGYDDDKECFIIRNSWGSNWGDKGYFYMPYEFISDPDLVGDVWAIRLME